MKRHRVFSRDFDFTANSLDFEVSDEWNEEIKELHRQNHDRMLERLIFQYGERGIAEKVDNLRTIGPKACSIVSYHNRFYNQARDAFIVGAYYPALTAACTLGERILNHLVIDLRDEFHDTPDYAFFAKGTTFSSWPRMIRALETWGVLLPTAAEHFRALLEVRNRAIHFNPQTAEQDQAMAITALKHVDEIIAAQFGTFGPQPWFIPEIGGVAPFIRKDWEEKPFVRLVYLPKCGKVGPRHRVEIDSVNGVWKVHDDEEYEEREITDEEFVRLYEAAIKRQVDTLPE